MQALDVRPKIGALVIDSDVLYVKGSLLKLPKTTALSLGKS
jgi:hypothetical protein